MATKSEYSAIDIANTDSWDMLVQRETEFPSSECQSLVVFGILQMFWGLSSNPTLVGPMRLTPLISLSTENALAWNLTLQYMQLIDVADE